MRASSLLLTCVLVHLSTGAYLHGGAAPTVPAPSTGPAPVVGAPQHTQHSMKPLPMEGASDHHLAKQKEGTPNRMPHEEDRPMLEKHNGSLERAKMKPNDPEGTIDNSAGGQDGGRKPHGGDSVAAIDKELHMQAQRTSRHQGGNPFTTVEVHEQPLPNEGERRRR